MTAHTITLHLPESLYERFVERAKWSRRSLENELLDVVAAAVPAEGEVSPDLLRTVDSLSALGDEELWRLAREPAPVRSAQALEALHLRQGDAGLSPAEEVERARLSQEYERSMLVRAQAAKLLRERGHDVSDLLAPL